MRSPNDEVVVENLKMSRTDLSLSRTKTPVGSMAFSQDGSFQWREPKSDAVSILFTGDISVSHSAYFAIEKTVNDTFNEAVLQFFNSADLRIAQWEMPLTNNPVPIQKAGPPLKAPPEAWHIAKKLNIDVALLANNHIGDFGPCSTMETIRILEEHGVSTVGAGRNHEEAAKPLRLKVSGRMVSILNAAEHEFGIATKTNAGAAELTVARMVSAISKERDSADIVIVAVHGGNEYRSHPSPRQQEWHHAFIDVGADIVFNCHAHQIQGIEIWNGRPIIYCPGNFFFPKNTRPTNGENWWSGFVPIISFDQTGAYNIRILPIHSSCTKVRTLSQEGRAEFFKNMMRISEDLFSPSCLETAFLAYCDNAMMEKAWIHSLPGSGRLGLKNWAKRSLLDFLCRIRVVSSSRLDRWKLHNLEVLCCESHLDVAKSLLDRNEHK